MLRMRPLLVRHCRWGKVRDKWRCPIVVGARMAWPGDVFALSSQGLAATACMMPAGWRHSGRRRYGGPVIWGRAFTDIGYRENVEGPCGKSSAFGECAAVAQVYSRLTYGYTPTRTALGENAHCTLQNAQCDSSCVVRLKPPRLRRAELL